MATIREDVCPFCNEQANLKSVPYKSHWVYQVSCRSCGEFGFHFTALVQLPPKDLHLISGFTREQTELRAGPLLFMTAQDFEDSKSAAPQGILEKANRLLTAIARKTTYPGQLVRLNLARDFPLAYCQNGRELAFLIEHLHNRKLVNSNERGDDSWGGELSADGWAKVEANKAGNIASDKVFVAMWFNVEMASSYQEGIKAAIENTGYRPVRIDREEFIGEIVDRILAEIRESRFVVADMTGQRGGMYFEGGFAMGRGLPVIWCCREDEIEKVHFDTRRFNHIAWKTPDDLRERLTNRIRATIGLGPRRMPDKA